MISSESYKKVHIHITTFKGNLETFTNKRAFGNMNEDRIKCKSTNNKFICSICLNSNKHQNVDDDRRISRHISAPKNCEVCSEKLRVRIKDENKINNGSKGNTVTKAVQTLPIDLNKSLNLLNEVLTVFQNKKQHDVKDKSKSLKDVSISTNDFGHILKPKLRISKVFQFSIDERYGRGDKFTIITSHDDIIRSQCSIDLPKHKSSSIPQMKLEELKHSMKEKTKSKDAIEEVNRMFATVKSRRQDISEDSNRPLVRNGPRILPVVKTDGPNMFHAESVEKLHPPCKNCQISDCLSSGDSFEKSEYCHHKQGQNDDNCIYMMCCHYKNCRKMQAGMVYCEHCHEERKFRCKHNNRNNKNYNND